MVNLQREINDCSSELLGVQTRLFQIMGRFKEMKARSNLITGFQLFIDNHPGFQPKCYPEQANLPLLFNQIEPLAIFDFHLHVIPHSEFNGNQFITGIDLWKK
jgi:hypothetical protein